jgi:N-acetylmuramoyl-L-alanine amidase
VSGGYLSPVLSVAVALILAMAVIVFQETRPPATALLGVAAAPLIADASAARGTPQAASIPAPTVMPTPLPPIQARVGLQVGHWQAADLPAELASLRTETGASAGGYQEVDLNLQIARQVAALLAARGIAVDLLPATVPPGYRADAFVAIHCDYNNDPGMSGFKLARYGDSTSPARDDTLLSAIATTYGATTGLPTDPHVTRAMTYYYAFNSDALVHAIAPQTPGVIIELGFLTNAGDRALLVWAQPTVATGVAQGIIGYLTSR